MEIEIRESDISTAVNLSQHIPEFEDPHAEEVYRERLSGKKTLILVAFQGQIPVGFKVGYDKFNDGSFYSWMGGVLPAYRQKHIARKLADVQETWARENGYTRIVFKTRNRHKTMLIFALSNGFSIIDVEPRASLNEYRILLTKPL
jgi:predicted GNAT superfamily acetyltransferase